MELFRAVRAFALDILFPRLCLSCERYLEETIAEAGLCESCVARVTLHTTLFCASCRARLPNNAKLCHRDAPLLLAAAADYTNDTIRKLIWQLKYERKTAALEPLAALLVRYLKNLPLSFANAVLVPIPLHPRRERKRGFNQAALIAEAVSTVLGIPLTHCLTRLRDTPPQVKLENRVARAVNIEGAFSVGRPELASGKHILLVDDVATSGMTLWEAARVLKGAGAKKVTGLVVAKAGF